VTLLFLSDLVVFEKAYCEYRLNRVESALKTIEAASEQTDKLKELYGQVVSSHTSRDLFVLSLEEDRSPVQWPTGLP
jgi:hypothetical protein